MRGRIPMPSAATVTLQLVAADDRGDVDLSRARGGVTVAVGVQHRVVDRLGHGELDGVRVGHAVARERGRRAGRRTGHPGPRRGER